ncbi:MAG: hypothetical protein PHD97_09185 [Bacteroidales bacterium]|nr:hypothetical protein [Bacteroidales bacterium]
MKTKKLLFGSLVVFAVFSLLFSNCKKDQKDTDTNHAGDNALAEKTFGDALEIADDAIVNNVNEFSILNACVTVTNDTTVTPHILTIKFDSLGCLGQDSRTRSGKIIVSYTGHYKDAGSTHTITFDNYFVDSNQVLGTKTVVNNGYNSSNHLTFTVHDDGQILLKGNAGTITWLADKTREFVEGESTSTRVDDVYLITGTSSGARATERTYTATTVTPLRVVLGCSFHHPVSGQINIKPDGKDERLLDYGVGDCDDVATVKIGKKFYTIKLR